ncbi:MAG: nucleoside-triphosphatase [Fidelibacterota bacterium]
MIDRAKNYKRLLISLAVLTGIIFLNHAPLLIAVSITVLSGLAYPASVRPLKNGKFWIVIFLLVIIVPLFTGPPDRTILGISYNHPMLLKTGFMALRGIVVFLLIQVITVDLDGEIFAQRLTRFGSPRFVILFQLARDILPGTRAIFNRLLVQNSFTTLYKPRVIFHRIKLVFAELIQLAEQLDQSSPERGLQDKDSLIDRITTPAMVIVTGRPGAGKTTWLMALQDRLKERSIPAGGILTVRQPESGMRWTLSLKNVSTGETRQVARMEPDKGTIKTEHYFFYRAVLDWGTEQITSTRERWLIIDEVGLFEFNEEGFFPALRTLDNQFSGVLVLALRKSLLPEFDSFLNLHFPRLHTWNQFLIDLDETIKQE